jgi:mannose-6-phosphate isomerase
VLYPFVFHPLFKERVWGGRMLEELYDKRLPPGVPIGESWEVSDRSGDESVVANGALAGRSLRWLMEHHAAEILGDANPAADGRFPLLCKILDARERLSLQVHPPDHPSHRLGEPKTELWHIVSAAPDALLYVGLKRGVTRQQFEAGIRAGNVADCFHRIPVRRGDTMFLPSGRVHAIGSGLVIFEIQQNSDTTFRVFDWNRVGLDGSPRELHVAESLASIDFTDFEPSLVDPHPSTAEGFSVSALIRHALFDVDVVRAQTDEVMALRPPRLRVLAVVEGSVTASGGGVSARLRPGQFCVLPASLGDPGIAAEKGAAFLVVEPN